jgi:adenylyltransferase/sulfurtransferase
MNPDMSRYARQLVLPGVGPEGQAKLAKARVLVVGMGGLGSPVALYLAAAGVGTLGIADADTVDVSNLQRQILHDTPSAGSLKVYSAAKRLAGLNPDVAVEKHPVRITAENAAGIIARYDVVVDGTDRVATRFLLNDACHFARKPLVYGAVSRFEGQATVFLPEGPCYRCIFPGPGAVEPLNCAEGGVLGVLPGLIGVIQATEALKLVLGLGEGLAGRLLLYDALGMGFRGMKVERDPGCNLCGDHPSIKGLVDVPEECKNSTGQGGNMLNIFGGGVPVISASELKAVLESKGAKPVLVDVREKNEWDFGHINGAIHIPLGQLSGRMKELDSAAPTVVYCRSGSRSSAGASMLKKAGFTDVRNLSGGMIAWETASK